MSYYYSYYVGYEKDGQIYPFGPYNSFGKLSPVIEDSRSFASDLHEDFYPVPENKISNELRKEFEYKDWSGNPAIDVKYLPVSSLPKGSFIKSGYFLIEDVKRYEEEGHPINFDGFYQKLDPVIYAAKLQNEITFGTPVCSNEYEYTASDYMFYSYIDYMCEEYDAYKLREMVRILKSSEYDPDVPRDIKYVILETEG